MKIFYGENSDKFTDKKGHCEMNRNIWISLTLAIVLLFSREAIAETEPAYDVIFRGISEGIPEGALPPHGTYFTINNYFARYNRYGSTGKVTIKNELDALFIVPTLLWSTGLQVFGADLAMSVSQPFDYTTWGKADIGGIVYGVNSNYVEAHWGTSNTIVTPIILSWALANDFYVRSGLTGSLKDGSTSRLAGTGNTLNDFYNGVRLGSYGTLYAPSSNGFWSLIPNTAVSWIHNGWNASIFANYAYNLKDTALGYQTGQTLYVDYSLTKKITEGWTVGVGFYSKNQTTKNKVFSNSVLANNVAANTNKGALSYGGGPIINYQFQKMNLEFQYNHNFLTKNDYGGDIYNFRLAFPLF